MLDTARGVLADPGEIRYADHPGQYVRTRGPLAMPRSPQVRPAFLQASASERGRERDGPPARRRPPRSVVAGTATTVAGRLQAVFEAGGCDGFILWPTVSPTMFERFGREVVPELQRRGLV